LAVRRVKGYVTAATGDSLAVGGCRVSASGTQHDETDEEIQAAPDQEDRGERGRACRPRFEGGTEHEDQEGGTAADGPTEAGNLVHTSVWTSHWHRDGAPATLKSAAADLSAMSKRLFVSVDLDGLAEDVAAVQEHLADASGLSLVDPAQAHVTLQFLGDTDPDRVDALVAELERAVEESDVSPFTASFEGLGVFPSLDYISVVWLGVGAGSAELAALHDAIEARTTAMGFEPDDHDFTPHVTLGRLQHAGDKERVQQVVREHEPTAGEIRVEEIRLTESVLTDDGPAYSTVASVALD